MFIVTDLVSAVKQLYMFRGKYLKKFYATKFLFFNRRKQLKIQFQLIFDIKFKVLSYDLNLTFIYLHTLCMWGQLRPC